MTTKRYSYAYRWVWMLAAVSVLCVATSLCAEEPAEKKQNAEKDQPKWTELFDGKTLKNWAVVDKWDFEEHGKVEVRDKVIHLEAGKPFTGLLYKGKIPTIDYEIEFEAMRTGGNDFFLNAVFPVGERQVSFVCGGWGGEVVGLTSVDGEPAVENQTAQYVEFEDNKWYKVRLAVTKEKIKLAIDGKDIVDLDHQDCQLSIYWEQEPLLPFGVSCWQTSSAIRAIRLRKLGEEPKENEEAAQ